MKELMLIQEIYRMPTGTARRAALMTFLDTVDDDSKIPKRLPVNRKYCANLADTDLRKLIKSGLVVREREGSRNCRQTYLVSAKLQQNTKSMEPSCPMY